MVDVIPNYTLPQIHCMMLGDEERLKAYNAALSLVKGKTVLDYGAGTGILSLMAARAGADKVYAIESSNAALAKQIIKNNGLEEKIEVVEGDIFNVDLPPVDAIISEWMGVWALQENMLPGLLYARDNFLNKNGLILPNKLNLHLVPSSESLEDLPNFKSIKGFDLSHYLTNLHSQPFVMRANSEDFISKSKLVHFIDLASLPSKNCTILDLQESYIAQRGDEITCLYGWFDADFYGVSRLDTSPNTITHWQQARFLPKKTISAKLGDEIKVKINSEVSSNDNRRINFNLGVFK